MPLAVQCPQCGKQFNPKPDLAGKRVKCSQCGGVISIPGAAAAAPQARKATAPPGSTAAANPPRGTNPARAAGPQGASPGTAPMRQPGPMQPAGGVGDILDDAKVGELVSATILRPGETMCPNCRAAVPMGGSVCVKCGFDFQAGKVFRQKVDKPLDPRVKQALGALGALVIVLVAVGVTVSLMLVVPLGWRHFELEKIDIAWKNYGLSLLVLGGAFSLLFNVSILADAFKEGAWKGLMYLFVPGYSIYFICTRWKACRKPFLASLLATWVTFTGMVMYVEGREIERNKPPEVKHRK